MRKEATTTTETPKADTKAQPPSKIGAGNTAKSIPDCTLGVSSILFIAAMISREYSTSGIQGLLDCQFQKLQMLQNGSDPNFIIEIVTLFCEEGKRIISEVAKLLDKPCVDFNKVYAFVHQLKGSSASIGAQRVNKTCIQFLEFCQEKSRDGCLEKLNVVRNEFYDVCSKFQTMLELEQQVQTFNPKN